MDTRGIKEFLGGYNFDENTQNLIEQIKKNHVAGSDVIILCALCRDIPVMVLTKDATFIEDREFMDWIENIKITSRDMVAFGFTLTGRDDMEPGASTNLARIEAMKKVYLMGFKTWASIEPVIDFPSSTKMIEDSMLFCDHYKIGLRSGVKKDYYEEGSLGYFVGQVEALCHIARIQNHHPIKVYWKNSVQKHLISSLTSFDKDFVSKDYSIFEE